ncbi:MAG: 6,7-dimethyl-8-ribityllumazine synthase [Phycisphaerales bacterium]|nr:6,7-dimethyl-8-ribityllumazine synthase [Phycisphaerales bacterium]
MSGESPDFEPRDVPPQAKIAIVAARFNASLVEKLLAGCLDRLKELGLDDHRVRVHRVPGAFELPLAAKALAQTKQYAAVICLGAVVRGQTAHFEYVAGECARGIAQVSLETKLPIIFGVLTTDTVEQAMDRLGGAHGHAGIRAAEAALEMIVLLDQIQPIR